MTDHEIARLESYSDEQLHQILRDDITFTEALIFGIPELAADNSFDLYGKEWLARYWKRLVIEVRRIPELSTSDAVMTWAIEATVGTLSVLIARHLNLPEAAIPASVAMAILIIRTAKRQSEAPRDTPSPEKADPQKSKNGSIDRG